MVTKNTPHLKRKEIHWNSIGHDAIGQYFCRVKIINTDIYVNKSWQLEVIESTLPSIVTSNIVAGQSQKYLLNDHVKLLCKFSGIPRPKMVRWYKNDNEIVRNDSHLSLLEDGSVLSIHLNADDEGKYKCIAENRAGRNSREMKLIIESKLINLLYC